MVICQLVFTSDIFNSVLVVIVVDSLLNETELEVVVYTGQLDLIVDTLGKSSRFTQLRTIIFFQLFNSCILLFFNCVTIINLLTKL